MARHVVQVHFSRLFSSIFFIAAFACVVSPGLAERTHPKTNRKDKDQYKHQVEKLEQAWRTAELNADADAMDKLLSDDYIGITMTGQVVTKNQQLERIRKRRLVLTRLDVDDVKVKLIGTTAVVTSRAQVEGNNDGTPMHGTFRYTRVYTRTASGTWKITNFEVTRVGASPRPSDGDAQSEKTGP